MARSADRGFAAWWQLFAGIGLNVRISIGFALEKVWRTVNRTWKNVWAPAGARYSSASVSRAERLVPKTKVEVVHVGGAIIRRGVSNESVKLGTLCFAERASLLEDQHGRLRIRTADGTIGWISEITADKTPIVRRSVAQKTSADFNDLGTKDTASAFRPRGEAKSSQAGGFVDDFEQKWERLRVNADGQEAKPLPIRRAAPGVPICRWRPGGVAATRPASVAREDRQRESRTKLAELPKIAAPPKPHGTDFGPGSKNLGPPEDLLDMTCPTDPTGPPHMSSTGVPTLTEILSTWSTADAFDTSKNAFDTGRSKSTAEIAELPGGCRVPELPPTRGADARQAWRCSGAVDTTTVLSTLAESLSGISECEDPARSQNQSEASSPSRVSLMQKSRFLSDDPEIACDGPATENSSSDSDHASAELDGRVADTDGRCTDPASKVSARDSPVKLQAIPEQGVDENMAVPFFSPDPDVCSDDDDVAGIREDIVSSCWLPNPRDCSEYMTIRQEVNDLDEEKTENSKLECGVDFAIDLWKNPLLKSEQVPSSRIEKIANTSMEGSCSSAGANKSLDSRSAKTIEQAFEDLGLSAYRETSTKKGNRAQVAGIRDLQGHDKIESDCGKGVTCLHEAANEGGAELDADIVCDGTFDKKTGENGDQQAVGTQVSQNQDKKTSGTGNDATCLLELAEEGSAEPDTDVVCGDVPDKTIGADV